MYQLYNPYLAILSLLGAFLGSLDQLIKRGGGEANRLRKNCPTANPAPAQYQSLNVTLEETRSKYAGENVLEKNSQHSWLLNIWFDNFIE